MLLNEENNVGLPRTEREWKQGRSIPVLQAHFVPETNNSLKTDKRMTAYFYIVCILVITASIHSIAVIHLSVSFFSVTECIISILPCFCPR